MAVDKTMVNSIGTAASKQPVNSGVTYPSPSSEDMSSVIGIALTASVVFGSTPDDSTTIAVMSSPDDSNFDTIAYAIFDIDEEASQTVQKTIRIGPEVKHVKSQATNNDSADSVTVWTAWTKMTT